MQVTAAKTVVLDTAQGPVVKLDDKFYKLVDKMDKLTIAPPSLKDAKSLTVKGPVKFQKGVVIKGDVLIVNGEGHPPPSFTNPYVTCLSSESLKPSCDPSLKQDLLRLNVSAAYVTQITLSQKCYCLAQE